MWNTVAINVFNTGGAEFEIHYNGRPTTAVFPFPACGVDKLRFDGGARVHAVTLINPATQTEDTALGQRVTVHYATSAKKGVAVVDGLLVRADASQVAVQIDAGTVIISRDDIETMLIHTDGAPHSAMPRLSIVYDADDTDATHLVVRGLDPAFGGFRVHHSVLMEPSPVVAGRAPSTLNVAASVWHTYAWPIDADMVTLTETETDQKVYATLSAAPRATMRAPNEQSRAPSGTSSNHGSITMKGGVSFQRAALGPTVVAIDRVDLPAAECHFVGTLDPTQPSGGADALSFAVRLKPALPDEKFIPSGPASVLIDMDPAPGVNNVAPFDLHLGFYHDAWCHKNRQRMYYRLGETTQVTASIEDIEDERFVENKQTGSITEKRRLVMTNATPYPMVFKLWMTSRLALGSVAASDFTGLSGVAVRNYHVVDMDEPAAGNTHTLQGVVDARQSKATCTLTVVYNPN